MNKLNTLEIYHSFFNEDVTSMYVAIFSERKSNCIGLLPIYSKSMNSDEVFGDGKAIYHNIVLNKSNINMHISITGSTPSAMK